MHEGAKKMAKRSVNGINLNDLPWTHAVWFVENGDDSYRICALTMCENDANAIVATDDCAAGTLIVMPFGETPKGAK
jgi:hypothetical protein